MIDPSSIFHDLRRLVVQENVLEGQVHCCITAASGLHRFFIVEDFSRHTVILPAPTWFLLLHRYFLTSSSLHEDRAD